MGAIAADRAITFFALGLTSLLALSGSEARAQAEDPWLGPDKALHYSLSAGLAAGGYGLAALGTDSRPLRLGIGFGGALALGVGKELYDAVGPGQASGKDLVWDALGAATGALVAWTIDWLVGELSGPDPPRPPVPTPRPGS